MIQLNAIDLIRQIHIRVRTDAPAIDMFVAKYLLIRNKPADVFPGKVVIQYHFDTPGQRIAFIMAAEQLEMRHILLDKVKYVEAQCNDYNTQAILTELHKLANTVK